MVSNNNCKMMTPFMQFWITATCAPESISIMRQNKDNALLKIVNEDNTKYVAVIESLQIPNYIVAIGTDYENLLNSKDCSLNYKEACGVIVKKLDLLTISITPLEIIKDIIIELQFCPKCKKMFQPSELEFGQCHECRLGITNLNKEIPIKDQSGNIIGKGKTRQESNSIYFDGIIIDDPTEDLTPEKQKRYDEIIKKRI